MFGVGGLAGTYLPQQAAPGEREASANAIQIQTQPHRSITQHLSWLVQREASGFGLQKDAFHHRVLEDPSKHIRVCSTYRCELVDGVDSGRDVVGNAQRCQYVDAPGRGEIAEREDVHLIRFRHVSPSMSCGSILTRSYAQLSRNRVQLGTSP